MYILVVILLLLYNEFNIFYYLEIIFIEIIIKLILNGIMLLMKVSFSRALIRSNFIIVLCI